MALRQRILKYMKVIKTVLTSSVIILDSSNVNVVLNIPNVHNQRPILSLSIHLSHVNKLMFAISGVNTMTYALARQQKFHKNLRLLWTTYFNPKQVILITDSLPKRTDYAKVIHLKYDYHPNVQLPDATHLTMPFTMHPQTYFYEPSPMPLSQYRQTERKYQVLFVGNSNPSYATKSIIEDCKLLDRHTIVSHLSQNPRFYALTGEKAEWYETIQHVLTSEDKCYVVLIGIRIWQENWLRTLAQSNFTLCPPGVTYPLSHNLVEAMSVGTIPILNYPDWLFPQLQDGVNCISFKTLEELDEKIELVAQMSDAKIAMMRQAVIEYYDQYLDPRIFANKLLSRDEKFMTLHVLDKFDGFVSNTLAAQAQ